MSGSNSVKQAPKPMSKLQTAAIIIIAFTVVFAAFYTLGVFDDFFQAQSQTPQNTPPPLTPARNLEGTWKTAFPVTFYIKTDFESFGDLQDVGSENRTMTWVITATSDENVVNVEVRFTVSNRLLVADSGYTPDVSPMFYKGVISGTRLTLETGDNSTIGQFNFTTDIITGTWSDHWSMVYEQQVYTATNALILTRQ